MKNHQTKQAIQIRSNIKAAVAQLDSWNIAQAEFHRRRVEANAVLGGRRRRVAEAIHRAKASQGTQLIEDPPCDICGSTSHLGDECDRIAVESTAEGTFEEPATGIHRSIVHRVYVLASELYLLHHPRFFPGPTTDTLASSDAYLLPVPLTGPDFQELALSQAVTTFLASSSAECYFTSSFLLQRALVDSVAVPYHSAAFVLDFPSFRDVIQERLSSEHL